MPDNERVFLIRSNERESHIAMYSNPSEHIWLNRPVKTVMEMLPYLDRTKKLRILDLGCGIGRNCIPIAEYFQGALCTIDCVDILDIAIEKLTLHAEESKVEHLINGILSSIDDYSIPRNTYDSIIAVSALEHVETEGIFRKKLWEIHEGIVPGGIVCLILNSSIREIRKSDECIVSPQFEVNLPAERLDRMLYDVFNGWNILKTSMVEQRYDIPRSGSIHNLESTVISFVAQKP